jgi:maleate isomerase
MNQTAEVRSRPADVRFDRGRNWRAKLGFVVLAMEQTVEGDVFRMVPDGVGVHFARIAMSNDATLETLVTMAPAIGDTARLLLPYDKPTVLCYTCNSGAMVIGETECMRMLRDAHEAAAPPPSLPALSAPSRRWARAGSLSQPPISTRSTRSFTASSAMPVLRSSISRA